MTFSETLPVQIKLLKRLFLKSFNRKLSFSANRPNKNVYKKETISDVKNYLKTKPSLQEALDFVPDRFIRIKRARASYSFVVDDEIASKISNILKHNSSSCCPWIEVNPGLGLVSRHLLKHGTQSLYLFDSLAFILQPLRVMMEENLERIKLIPNNMFEMFRVVAQDKLDNGDRISKIFSDFPVHKWEEDPVANVYGVLTTSEFIGYMVRSIISQDQYSKFGRFEYFFLVSEVVYKRVIEGHLKLRLSILLSYFFEVKLLEKFPRTCVLPWDSKEPLKMEDRIMYLLKVTPKPNIYNEHSEEELKVLWYFIHNLYRSKFNKIIPFFESWIPDSGLLLIKEGFHPMTEVKSISIPELIYLFKLFICHPDFDKASFIHLHEAALMDGATDGS